MGISRIDYWVRFWALIGVVSRYEPGKMDVTVKKVGCSAIFKRNGRSTLTVKCEAGV